MPNATPSLPSAQYDFSRIPTIDAPRSSFKRPQTYKTAFSAGKLIPVYIDEVLPGDTFTVDASVIARLSTPLVPIMDNLYLDAQFFFVPNRLLWEHWENMCGERKNPGDSVEYSVPYVTGQCGADSLGDYFGLPVGKSFSPHDVSALPFRAYNLIWNEWYRDENIQDSVTVNLNDSPQPVTDFSLLPRGKRKDYFTSCLPWPQKGLSVSVSGNVFGTGSPLGLRGFGSPFVADMDYALGTKYTSGSYSFLTLGTASGEDFSATGAMMSRPVGVSSDPSASGLTADININNLRQSLALQMFLEASARGGTRYIELIKQMFGVDSPDARLQRPELLGTWSVPVEFNSVAQTSATQTSQTPQGNLSAFALANGLNRCFSKSFVEHGYVIGLVSVRSDLTYQQGLHKMWSRSTYLDFYWPQFSALGEQAVLNKELYYQGSSVKDGDKLVDDKVFGYQERFAEYKYGHSRITGQLRSTYAQSLDLWHLSQKFDTLPTLSNDFIVENPPLARCLAVSDAPQFILDSFWDVTCVRPMPMYCIPGLVPHF